MRPKKKTPDRRGVLLKEQPFSYRPRRTARSRSSGGQRRATTLTGRLAEHFLAVAPEPTSQELQLLMAKATGNFKRGNEKRR